MYKFKNSVIAFFGLLTVGAIAAVLPHTSFGQDAEPQSALNLNCDMQPCDSVAASPVEPVLPPFISSNGLVVDRGFVTADERLALLAYLQKL